MQLILLDTVALFLRGQYQFRTKPSQWYFSEPYLGLSHQHRALRPNINMKHDIFHQREA